MKILFLGSSNFSVIVLNKMLEEGLNVCGVITQPDKPSGRGHKVLPTIVKKFAIEKGIEVYTFDRIRNHIDEIKNIDYDLAVVASFGQILPEDFLNIKLTINVHPSLLPKYRGASPLQSALLNDDDVTGVTIMKVAKEVDSGDILLQKEFKLGGEYFSELEQKLGIMGGEMVAQAVKQIEDGSASFTPQDHKKATFVQKFTKEDGKINLNKTAKEIVAQVRALSEETGCYISLPEYDLKVGRCTIFDGEASLDIGEILNNKKRFVIGCKDAAIEILTCQAPSGKMISGRDFLNGHNTLLGQRINN